jgi:hypothetical protein
MIMPGARGPGARGHEGVAAAGGGRRGLLRFLLPRFLRAGWLRCPLIGRYVAIGKTGSLKLLHRQRHVRIGLGLGSLALVGTGAAVYHHDRGVAYKAGVSGATGTLQGLRQAEQGDAASWCHLASSTSSSTCVNLPLTEPNGAAV